MPGRTGRQQSRDELKAYSAPHFLSFHPVILGLFNSPVCNYHGFSCPLTRNRDYRGVLYILKRAQLDLLIYLMCIPARAVQLRKCSLPTSSALRRT